MPCPVCKQPVPIGAEVCPNANCREDLRSLAVIDTFGQGLYRLALQRVRDKKPEEALQLLNAAAVYAPANVDIWVVLGKLEAQAKRYEQAVRAWQKALSLRSDETRALEGIREVNRARQRRRLSLWTAPLIAALAIFLCGLAGGRQSLALFPEGPAPVSPTAAIATHTEVSPVPATETSLPAATPTPTETVAPTVETVTAAAQMCQVSVGLANSKLYVRGGPGTGYPALGWVSEGDLLTVLEKPESSAWVKVITPSGLEGFVNARFCR